MNEDSNAKIETEEEFSADLITPVNLGEIRGFLKGLDTTAERESDRL